MVLNGAMNGEASRAYVEQVLVPELAAGDVVVMGNLPAHKVGAFGRLSNKPTRPFYTSPILPRLQPDRDGFRQAQSPATRRCHEVNPGPLGRHRTRHPTVRPKRMPKLLRYCRIRCLLIGKRSKAPVQGVHDSSKDVGFGRHPFSFLVRKGRPSCRYTCCHLCRRIILLNFGSLLTSASNPMFRATEMTPSML